MSRLYHASITHRMFKKACVFTRPPQRAKTHRSTGKAAASEEAEAYFGPYGESLSAARTPLEAFFNILDVSR